jgi:hypothetical protein
MRRWPVVLAFACLAAAGAAGAQAPVVAGLFEGDALASAWRFIGWPQQKPPLTRYSVEDLSGVPGAPGERQVLRIEARQSYGNLVQALPAVPAPQRLSWTWRVTQGNPAVALNQKAGDDTPAKVCLGFDLPLAQVPFVERQLLRMARSRSAEVLPAATLCWAWGGAEAIGQVVENPYSRRVRTIVLRRHTPGVGSPADTWQDEQRDVVADFLRVFGDEAKEVPPVIALIVAGDADNTRGHSVAQLTALHWRP